MRYALFVTLLLAATAATAEIFRSVDADGNVTFSSTPPPEAVQVDQIDTRAGPSEEQSRAAQERLERMRSTADEMRESREAREAARAEQRAEQRAASGAGTQPRADYEDDRGYWWYAGRPLPVRPVPRPPLPGAAPGGRIPRPTPRPLR